MTVKTILVNAAFVALLGVPYLASAQDTPPQPMKSWSIVPEAAVLTGPEYMEKGESSYGAGEYEKALGFFQKAVGLVTGKAELAKIHARLAFIYAAFDQMDKVYPEFVESLKLDSSLKLDQDMVSPKIYESFLKARDEVVREGTLVCNCDPGGAEVYLNDTLVGEAPVKKEHIPEGEYTLSLRKPGYENTSGRISIKKDVTLTVEDKLVPARGELDIRTEPPGVRVVMDGKDAGVSPVTLEKVSGGSHTVKFVRDYFEPEEKSVTMKPAEHVSVEAALKRRLLVIGVVAGREDGVEINPALAGLMEGRLSEMGGVKAVMTGMKAVSDGLRGRGLDAVSLSFLMNGNARLALEDSAVLSGIMEKSGAELALVARLSESGGRYSLGLTLYSTACDSGDRVVLTANDMDGLGEEFARFLVRWKGQQRAMRPSLGARLVDRAAGGVEVISVLSGSPAAAAGLTPGDLIGSVDGANVGSKDVLMPLLKPDARLKMGFMQGGRYKETTLAPVYAPVEAPVYSPDYLYNLALVDTVGILDSPAPTEAGKADDRRGLAALDLGNVYTHMGEYEKAIKAYQQARTAVSSGVCAGTALYRLGQAYEKKGLWSEAADSYRKAMMLYPDATLESADGPPVAAIARERLIWLYETGLVKEKWWL